MSDPQVGQKRAADAAAVDERDPKQARTEPSPDSKQAEPPKLDQAPKQEFDVVQFEWNEFWSKANHGTAVHFSDVKLDPLDPLAESNRLFVAGMKLGALKEGSQSTVFDIRDRRTPGQKAVVVSPVAYTSNQRLGVCGNLPDSYNPWEDKQDGSKGNPADATVKDWDDALRSIVFDGMPHADELTAGSKRVPAADKDGRDPFYTAWVNFCEVLSDWAAAVVLERCGCARAKHPETGKDVPNVFFDDQAGNAIERVSRGAHKTYGALSPDEKKQAIALMRLARKATVDYGDGTEPEPKRTGFVTLDAEAPIDETTKKPNKKGAHKAVRGAPMLTIATQPVAYFDKAYNKQAMMPDDSKECKAVGAAIRRLGGSYVRRPIEVFSRDPKTGIVSSFMHKGPFNRRTGVVAACGFGIYLTVNGQSDSRFIPRFEIDSVAIVGEPQKPRAYDRSLLPSGMVVA